MWVVALMAALMLGSALGAFGSMADTTTDDTSEADEDTMEPDPVTPLPEPAEEETPVLTEEPVVAEEPVVDPVVPEETPEVVVVPPVVGLALEYNGDATISGGAGDDTLLGDPDDEIAEVLGTTQIDLGAGNDLAQISLDALTVNGGDGNDTLEGLAGNATLNGGVGDDVLSGNDESLLEGEAGNDSITVGLDFPFEGDTGETTVLSGDGDDVITIESGIRAFNDEGELVRASGGAGADTFTLELEIEDEPLVVDGPTTAESSTGIRILDFDAAEDILQIELSRPEGAADCEPSDVTFTREDGEAEFGPFTEVTLVFDGTDTVMPFETSFFVHGADTLTIENIVFVEPAAAEDTMAEAVT